MEQTLFICKEVDLYKLPPRGAAVGWRSGEWRVDDKIFTARCRVVAVGDTLEVRLEDPANGEIFGLCPVPPGQRSIAVESATDSSRNFVLRIEDPVTKRHAFLGMSFAERSNAFDFNVALTDFERQLSREKEIAKLSTSSNPIQAAQTTLPEAAALYRHEDLSLKEGESIKIEVKKKVSESGTSGGGFLSRLGGNSAGAAVPTTTTIATLAPPPTLRPPPAPPSLQQQQQQQQTAPAVDLLGGDAAVAAFDSFDFAVPRSTEGQSTEGQQGGNGNTSQVVASTEEGWATF